MQYDYQCQKCGKEFSRIVPMADRDKPLLEKCPGCGKKKSIIRGFVAAKIVYDISNPLKRAGSGWNDLMKKMAKGAGRHSKIDHY